MTIEEVRALIATPMKNEAVKQAYLFSCFCGLRISDIISLKWKDVFVDRGQYRLAVSMQKTKEPIYLPLSPEALKWMPERGEKTSEDHVFDLPSPTMINTLLKPWAKAAGIDKRFSFHTSRHTFATMMLTLGADLYTTSKLLGHADVKMTQVYAKIINQKKDDTIGLIDTELSYTQNNAKNKKIVGRFQDKCSAARSGVAADFGTCRVRNHSQAGDGYRYRHPVCGDSPCSVHRSDGYLHGISRLNHGMARTEKERNGNRNGNRNGIRHSTRFRKQP
ncbi:Tyrosine recombinase XerD [Rikenella microfusus]|uniref:Tyrosine recombinase XerD n=1 Tax=Rikenella microfusus TaxID=28139 RepID=A0A379MUK5_9BACT|nr:Tyrosine recombinase XerD [Rikenella microfusus]